MSNDQDKKKDSASRRPTEGWGVQNTEGGEDKQRREREHIHKERGKKGEPTAEESCLCVLVA